MTSSGRSWSACSTTGAEPADIGQADVRWVVLADPEGNELCVLDPRDDYAQAGAMAAIVLDTPDPAALAPFWSEAAGWPIVGQGDDYASLARPDGVGPQLELIRVDDPKVAKNRVHIDVAPYAADDQGAEVCPGSAGGERHRPILGRGSRPGWCWPTPTGMSSAC
jgi:Glyoxalase-like domain